MGSEYLNDFPELPLSGNGLKKLGNAIRAQDELTLDQRDQVEIFHRHLGLATPQLVGAVRQILSERFPRAQLEVTGRPKGWPTIIDKLNRGTSLERVRDVVGARVVLPETFTRADQDRACNVLKESFESAAPRVIDRRAEPSHGYRALHLDLKIHKICCEIQIRTHFQHQWAEISEQVSDALGRGLRYGDIPPGLSDSDIKFWEVILSMADLVSRHEEMTEMYHALGFLDALGNPPRWARARLQFRQQERELARLLRELQAIANRRHA